GLAEALAAELRALAARWPPGPIDAAAAAAVQQLRAEADLRGLHRPRLGDAAGAEAPLAAGTVIVDPEPAFRPAPGLRTVRVHPLPELGRLPEVLAPWRGRLQGVALAGVAEAAAAERLAAALTALGVSRIAPPGELQRPDALWHNGGASPLAALTTSGSARS
ncbi:MAG TPA: acyl-CoA reductase, partial [Thermoanaerobaculia bacterium]|nr:acyl-CoA reductase [Thermoanaerobaculia bacterium]